MRPIGNVIEIVATAFRPLQCGVDLVEHGETLRLHVFDDDEQELLCSRLRLAALQDDRALREAIYEARLCVSERGVPLGSWQFPRH
jgi:hypothetical protein